MRYLRFTNDGWYARYDDGLNKHNVRRIADAAAAYWADLHGAGTVYIGYDTRRRAAEFADEAASVVGSWGLDVVVSDGPCPMPALNHAVRVDPGSVGALMLTADHRSSDYLGVRVRNRDSSAIGEEEADAIEALVSQDETPATGVATYSDYVSPFLESVSAAVDGERIRAAGLSCVIDPMYGTARGVAAGLLRSMGVSALEIHGDLVDDFGGMHPEVVEPWLDDCEYVTGKMPVDLGIAIDGPSNRAAAIDENGRFITAPKLHALLIAHLVKNRGLTGRIVVPRFCSTVVRRLARQLGLDVMSVAQGPIWPFEEIKQGGVVTASDGLGGICIPSIDRERNAFATTLLLVEMLAMEGRPLSSLVNDLDRVVGSMEYGQRELRIDPGRYAVLRNLLPGINPGRICHKEPMDVRHADGLYVQFEDETWLYIRPSASEPLVRIHGEGVDRADRDELLDAACSLLQEL